MPNSETLKNIGNLRDADRQRQDGGGFCQTYCFGGKTNPEKVYQPLQPVQCPRPAV